MMKSFAYTIPRILLGLIFFTGSINGFALIFTGASLFEVPASEAGNGFMASLHSMSFLFPMLKLVELMGSILLLTNRAPALGLILLAPAMVVITAFHFLLNPLGIPLGITLIVCGSLVALHCRESYALLLSNSTDSSA